MHFRRSLPSPKWKFSKMNWRTLIGRRASFQYETPTCISCLGTTLIGRVRVSSRRRTKLPRLLGALTHKRFADVRWGSIATFPVGNVANEQIQAVGKLIEVAVSQPMGWQRAGADVIRLGAGVVRFLVSAVVKLPIGFQLRA